MSINKQVELLNGVKKYCSFILDTTFFSEADLRRSIEARYTEGLYRRKLNVNLISFGFKHGQVNPVDLLIDLRFIDNPYHVKGLAPFSGLDEKIQNFLRENKSFNDTFNRTKDFCEWILPKYYIEGKHYLNVGFGCSGGRHRSVFMVESIASFMQSKLSKDFLVNKAHRDIKKL